MSPSIDRTTVVAIALIFDGVDKVLTIVDMAYKF
jgi:hypothetical protein